MSTRSTITTHVLDSATGTPARGILVELTAAGPASADAAAREAGPQLPACARTDDDGRVTTLGPPDLPPGTYRLRFDTGAWFAERGIDPFYPEVTLTVVLEPGRDHLHVPILLSPYAYTTYRGS